MLPPQLRARSLPAESTRDNLNFLNVDTMASERNVIDLTEEVNEEDVFSRIVQIDPHGDLKLIVGEEKVCFIVCSRALSRSAPVWKKMLYGPFAEAKPKDGRDWKVKLPEDHPAAFEIILNLVHWPGQPDKIPQVDLKLAFEVTVLTNKYLMTHCLLPCARIWLADLLPAPKTDKHGETLDTWTQPLQWLWIAQELGDSTQFLQAFKPLALRTAYLGDCYSGDFSFCGDGVVMSIREWKQTLSPAGKVVIDDLIAWLQEARLAAISEMKSQVQTDIDILNTASKRYRSVGPAALARMQCICRAKEIAGPLKCQCDLTMLGLTTIWQRETKWPLQCKATDAHGSVKRLWGSYDDCMRRFEKVATWIQGKTHEACTPFSSGLPSWDVLDKLVGDIAAQKLEYIRRQAILSGLERGDSGEVSRKRTHEQMKSSE